VDSSPGTGHPQRRGVHQSGATSADLGQGPARAGLHGLGQATEHVGELAGPSRAGVWSSGTRHGAPPTAQGRRRRRPPTDACIPRRRRSRSSSAQLSVDSPLAVGDRHQLLGAVGAHAHGHQAAQPGLLQPHPEVDAVGPAVHDGRITDRNRIRSPLTGSVRRSSTRGARTEIAPAAVVTSRWRAWPLRTTSRRPCSSRSAACSAR
jgi:hypothetical protein